MIADTHGAKGTPWIGFDLDGTLAEYHGWRGIMHIGKPIQRIVDLAKRLHSDGKEIRIVTARVAPGEDPVMTILARAIIASWCRENLGFVPPITHEKDALMETLYDDRVHAVEQNTGRVLNTELAKAKNAWHGNPYKCPYCGSTNGWTYDGHCKSKRCGKKLSPHDQAERINEIVRRKLSVDNPKDINNLATITGVPVDILKGKFGRGKRMEHGSGALKLRQKHGDLQGKDVDEFRHRDNGRIGFTLVGGKFGSTTTKDKHGKEVYDPSRKSIIHGRYVGYFDTDSRPGRLTMTTHYRSGKDAAKESERQKKARR